MAPTPLGSDYVPENRLGEKQEIHPIDLFLCHSCGYSGIIDVVDNESIYQESGDVTSHSLGLVDHLRQYAEDVIESVKPNEGDLFIDIGSNDGTLLKRYQKKGMRVLGVEPAKALGQLATEAGVPTIRGYFTSELARTIKAEHGQARVVTANRVVANIDSLADAIEGVSHLLAPDGVFIFETGYVVDLIQNMLFDTIYHEHLGYDSVKPLDGFFRRHEMELVNVERLPLKGGSIRGTVQNSGGPLSICSTVAEMVSEEEKLGVHSTEFFDTFVKRMEESKSQLQNLLRGITEEGKTIAGYGASVGSTTMIYHLGLGDSLSFLVDDDPRNQYLFSPGHHIPVYPSEAIYERNPDYVLVLAWRYAEPIIGKHKAYLNQGGHFVVPFPEFRVI